MRNYCNIFKDRVVKAKGVPTPGTSTILKKATLLGLSFLFFLP